MPVTRPIFVKPVAFGIQKTQFVDFKAQASGIRGPQWVKFLDLNNNVHWALLYHFSLKRAPESARLVSREQP